MNSYYMNQNKKKLILFFAGWGMDEHPFLHLTSNEYNTLIIYNYEDLNLDINLEEFLKNFNEIHLVAWSMGVYHSQKMLYPYKDVLTSKIAINGTLFPIDNQFGIPIEMYDATTNNFSEKGRLSFYRRMCKNKELYSWFLENQPQRSVESQKNELKVIKQRVLDEPLNELFFNNVLIVDKDRIIPTNHQQLFWKKRCKTQILEGSHYLFKLFNKWENILEYAKN